jgi:hypothetical protein
VGVRVGIEMVQVPGPGRIYGEVCGRFAPSFVCLSNFGLRSSGFRLRSSSLGSLTRSRLEFQSLFL